MVNIKINYDDKDSKNVAKIVIVNEQGSVLFLKRKGAKHEWDLPGGHIKKDEAPLEGLQREVFEETKLKINLNSAKVFKKERTVKKGKESTLSFFYIESEIQLEDIKISTEHSEPRLFRKTELSKLDKFQSIALDVLEKLKK